MTANGAEAAKNAVDTYWDTSIFSPKPPTRIHDDTYGPTPQTTILSFKDLNTNIHYPCIGANSIRIRDYPVEIHFWVKDRTDRDKIIKAIEKVFGVSDYTAGCGYFWNNFSCIAPEIAGAKSTDWYEVTINVNKHEVIRSWS